MEATASEVDDDRLALAGEPGVDSSVASELRQDEQQQQLEQRQRREGDVDDGRDGSIGGPGEGQRNVPPEGKGSAREDGGMKENADQKADDGHDISHAGRRREDSEAALVADNTAAAAASKGEELEPIPAAAGNTAGSPSAGKTFEPPLSPQQQQQRQQQQQNESPTEEIQSDERVGESTLGHTPSAPLAPNWPPQCDPTYRMPEELIVRVLIDGEMKEMPIKIERFEGTKVFQGGYRHRGTGRMFHHASTQFGQRERPVKETGHLRTRNTQTCKIKTTTIQTTNECGTQMARNDMHLDDGRDTFKTAGEYQTAGEYWRVRERKTVTIQRFWRGFSARSRVWSRREEKWILEEKEMELAAEQEAKKASERQKEMQRRMNPSTVQDFEILYTELDRWRNVETKRIKEGAVGERRKLALRELLHKETRLLQTIDRLKITAAHEGKERRTRRMLELMSAPKQWEMGDGEVSEIHTPWTNRARELQELYEALEAPLLGVEERLDVLLHLKWTVGEFDCRLTRDIAELVDREADLLSRGRGEASLRPLRQRIRNLFLRFAETPDFNPEATRFVRVPPKYGKLTDEGMAGLAAGGLVSCNN